MPVSSKPIVSAPGAANIRITGGPVYDPVHMDKQKVVAPGGGQKASKPGAAPTKKEPGATKSAVGAVSTLKRASSLPMDFKLSSPATASGARSSPPPATTQASFAKPTKASASRTSLAGAHTTPTHHTPTGRAKPVRASSPPPTVTSKPVRVATPPAKTSLKPARAATPPAKTVLKPARTATPSATVALKPARAVSPPMKTSQKPSIASPKKATAEAVAKVDKSKPALMVEVLEVDFIGDVQLRVDAVIDDEVAEEVPRAFGEKTNGLEARPVSIGRPPTPLSSLPVEKENLLAVPEWTYGHSVPGVEEIVEEKKVLPPVAQVRVKRSVRPARLPATKGKKSKPGRAFKPTLGGLAEDEGTAEPAQALDTKEEIKVATAKPRVSVGVIEDVLALSRLFKSAAFSVEEVFMDDDGLDGEIELPMTPVVQDGDIGGAVLKAFEHAPQSANLEHPRAAHLFTSAIINHVSSDIEACGQSAVVEFWPPPDALLSDNGSDDKQEVPAARVGIDAAPVKNDDDYLPPMWRLHKNPTENSSAAAKGAKGDGHSTTVDYLPPMWKLHQDPTERSRYEAKGDDASLTGVAVEPIVDKEFSAEIGDDDSTLVGETESGCVQTMMETIYLEIDPRATSGKILPVNEGVSRVIQSFVPLETSTPQKAEKQPAPLSRPTQAALHLSFTEPFDEDYKASPLSWDSNERSSRVIQSFVPLEMSTPQKVEKQLAPSSRPIQAVLHLSFTHPFDEDYRASPLSWDSSTSSSSSSSSHGLRSAWSDWTVDSVEPPSSGFKFGALRKFFTRWSRNYISR